MAEEETSGRARRPPPERAREDDRLCLLRPPEAGRAGLHPVALGGARRKGAPAGLRQGPGARPGSAPAARGLAADGVAVDVAAGDPELATCRRDTAKLSHFATDERE